MTASSVLIIIRRYSEYAVMGLIGVVVTQALGYGLIFDLNFFLRNLSVMGGLLMVLSDSWVRKKFAPAGLPQLDEKDRKMYFQLAGRVLLIFLFIGFVFAGDWSVGRIFVIVVGLVACVMVVVGFKAKWSAIILVMILSIFNILVNNFWTVSALLLSPFKLQVLTILSYTLTTLTRTLRNTTSSRFSPSWEGCCSWSTWGQAKSASMRRRRCIRCSYETRSGVRSLVAWIRNALRMVLKAQAGYITMLDLVQGRSSRCQMLDVPSKAVWRYYISRHFAKAVSPSSHNLCANN
jgi:uncharacterized membrane protein YphA (DoxX/SURF4 family)